MSISLTLKAALLSGLSCLSLIAMEKEQPNSSTSQIQQSINDAFTKSNIAQARELFACMPQASNQYWQNILGRTLDTPVSLQEIQTLPYKQRKALKRDLKDAITLFKAIFSRFETQQQKTYDAALTPQDRVLRFTYWGLPAALAFIGTYSIIYAKGLGLDYIDLSGPTIVALAPCIMGWSSFNKKFINQPSNAQDYQNFYQEWVAAYERLINLDCWVTEALAKDKKQA